MLKDIARALFIASVLAVAAGAVAVGCTNLAVDMASATVEDGSEVAQ